VSRPVIITCAVNGGSAAALAEHDAIPVEPRQICASALEAVAAGASIVHVHVRDPETSRASNQFNLYAEVARLWRAAGTEALLNLTCSMDGHIALDGVDRLGEATTLRSPRERVRHALELRPEIGTLDCGVMGAGESIFVARMSDLREMAGLFRDAGIKPEIECFDFGHIENARSLIVEGLIAPPPFIQICLGAGYGAPADPHCLRGMRAMLPDGVTWAAFACGPAELPVLAETVLSGGHVRVGLEDNRRLLDGRPATNAALVAQAVQIIQGLGERVATPAEARELLRI
jgi:uncharacterized protein (DUF849 family)